MLDEAVVCVKCGCPVNSNVSEKLIEHQKHSKRQTAFILNLIAFIIGMFPVIFTLIATTLGISNDTTSEGFTVTVGAGDDRFSNIFFYSLVFVLITFIMGLITYFKLRKDKTNKIFPRCYLAVACIKMVLILLSTPSFMTYIFCGFGLLFYVPSLLYIIASVKFLQSIHEE